MKTDGQEFLDELSGFPSRSFERNFVNTATRLGLGCALDRRELNLLFGAAFLAALCNISINGLGGSGGIIRLEHEIYRTNLEKDFLATRDDLYASAGWRALSAARRGSLQRIFLNVFVTADNLAW